MIVTTPISRIHVFPKHTQKLQGIRRIQATPRQTQKSKHFKHMEIFYKFLHIFCFLDFGFFECKSCILRFFFKCLTIVSFAAFCYTSVLTCEMHYEFSIFIWFCITLVHYFFTLLALVFINPNKTYYRFFFDLESIDFKLQIDNSPYNMEIKILIMCLLHITFKVIVCIIYFIFVNTYLGVSIICNFLVTCSQLVLLSYSSVFYSINLRLKKLVMNLETANSDFSSLQLIYKSIVELAEDYKTTFDALFIIELLFNIPSTMVALYYSVLALIDEKFTGLSSSVRVEYIVTAENLMALFAPAISASMLATQAHKIKIILHDKLLQADDISNIRDIAKFIWYVEARGCRFRVCKVVPFDADLPGMVLSFCVTYLIVIMQFIFK